MKFSFDEINEGHLLNWDKGTSKVQLKYVKCDTPSIPNITPSNRINSHKKENGAPSGTLGSIGTKGSLIGSLISPEPFQAHNRFIESPPKVKNVAPSAWCPINVNELAYNHTDKKIVVRCLRRIFYSNLHATDKFEMFYHFYAFQTDRGKYRLYKILINNFVKIIHEWVTLGHIQLPPGQDGRFRFLYIQYKSDEYKFTEGVYYNKPAFLKFERGSLQNFRDLNTGMAGHMNRVSARIILDGIRNLTERLGMTKPKSCTDIGCSNGYLLYAMAQLEGELRLYTKWCNSTLVL